MGGAGGTEGTYKRVEEEDDADDAKGKASLEDGAALGGAVHERGELLAEDAGVEAGAVAAVGAGDAAEDDDAGDEGGEEGEVDEGEEVAGALGGGEEEEGGEGPDGGEDGDDEEDEDEGRGEEVGGDEAVDEVGEHAEQGDEEDELHEAGDDEEEGGEHAGGRLSCGGVEDAGLCGGWGVDDCFARGCRGRPLRWQWYSRGTGDSALGLSRQGGFGERGRRCGRMYRRGSLGDSGAVKLRGATLQPAVSELATEAGGSKERRA